MSQRAKPLKRYTLTRTVTALEFIDVEATSVKEAKELANQPDRPKRRSTETHTAWTEMKNHRKPA